MFRAAVTADDISLPADAPERRTLLNLMRVITATLGIAGASAPNTDMLVRNAIAPMARKLSFIWLLIRPFFNNASSGCYQL